MSYYYTMADENGVLCVDRLDTMAERARGQETPEDEVVRLARAYPDVIYFEHPHVDPVDPGPSLEKKVDVLLVMVGELAKRIG